MHRRYLGTRMPRLISLFFIIIASLSLNSAVPAQTMNDIARYTHGLMPVPANVTWRDGRLPLTKAFNIALTGQTDDRLRSYAFRATRRLERTTVIEFPRDFGTDAATATLVIETRSTGNSIP